jgi:tRNA 2-selenouridine synthase
MEEAFQLQWREGDLSLHREWVAFLLEKYYDPMYEYQLSQRAGEQLYRGDREAVIARAGQDS